MAMELVFWRFLADPTGVGEASGFASAGYDDHRWREVRVPVDFETCHPALDTYEGPGWYRHWVVLPDAWAGQRVVLSLAGVNARAEVWVNGVKVGVCTDPFLPFEFEIQAQLKFGDRNLIAVVVDNTRRAGDVPGMQRGWRNFGGLLREVTVRATDLCHLDGVDYVAVPANGGGALSLRAMVQNGQSEAVTADVVAVVTDSDGQHVARLTGEPQTVGAGAAIRIGLRGEVRGAAPWSPEAPNLYNVNVLLQSDGAVLDTCQAAIGFRSIEAREEQLWLNGAPITLTGFNRHEDSPERNMCPDLALARRDLESMKSAGANFVRLCHYPHHPGELGLCDELGLLVMDEIPLYWWHGLEDGVEAASAKLESAKRQLERMIRRDANHPSVVFWSVSNETDETRPEVIAGNGELVRLAKDLDPTRLAVHVSDHWQRILDLDGSGAGGVEDARSGLFEDDDVICVNGYPSAAMMSYTDGRGRAPAFDGAAVAATWRDWLAALHACYPGKPILVTEFGYVSFHDVFAGAFSEDLHAEVLACEFAGMEAAYVCGATVWCWADHAWPPATFGFCGSLATSPYGVVTRDRRRKAAYRTVSRIFRERQGLGGAETLHSSEPGPSGREIYMVRPNMRDIPVIDLPDGYSIRTLRPDEGGLWTDIWREADPWGCVEPTLFAGQFGADLPAVAWRSFIVEDSRGVGVATITAWYNRTYKGEDYGQIHWVATRQSYWGRGIGKAMLSHALQQMARWHNKAFLGTQTKRIPAIKLYLDLGFVPDRDHEGARDAWREVQLALSHPVLDAMSL